MLRKIISIGFLALLLLSGSGITYMLSTQVAHQRARAEKNEILKSPEFITLNENDFNSLQKDYIAADIYEVYFNGNKYDVYQSSENANGSVTISVKQDKEEENIQQNFQGRNNDDSNQKLTAAPFYFFGFINEQENFYPSPVILNLQIECNHFFVMSAFSSVISPPPEFTA